ncbi:sigma 54-interacting transcriptional regulator [candidate division WOR-3 bacterium]|nr:sigma 54-interacting transcriptional regulator [candidate division WOR-3 bacterium]
MKEIGSYIIVERIGKSHYAELYKVRERGSRVSLTFKIAREPDYEFNTLIAREFHILSKFNHKSIMKVYDYGSTADKRAYFTGEFVPGVSIDRCFKGYSAQLVDAIIQLLDALIQFHDHNYFHGDLKPEHILYDLKQKRTCLIDFGFASQVDDWKAPRGSFGYIAPEVLKGQMIDQRSDLYSLGVIMYEILSRSRVRESMLSKAAVMPSFSRGNLDPGTPEEMQGIVQRLMFSEPALRPTVGAIYETLCGFSARKEPGKPISKVSLPHLHFIDVNRLTTLLCDPRKAAGKTFIIYGDKGLGKTRSLSELRFKHLVSGYTVLSFSAKTGNRLFEGLCEYAQCELKSEQIRDRTALFEELVDSLKTKVTNKDEVLVIMVDDLDELNSFNRAFFRYLGFSITDSGIVVIATSEPSSEIEKMGFESLQLRGFTQPELKELLEKTFMKRLDEDGLSDWLHGASGGNPLFINELLKYLSQKKRLCYEEGKWQLRSEALTATHYPKGIEDIVFHKTEELDESCTHVLQLVCLYNNPMELVILTEMAGMNGFEAVECLKQRGFIKVAQLGGRLAYTVADKITREIVSRSMPPDRRAVYYRQFLAIIKEKFRNAPEYFPILAELADACNNAEDALEYSHRAAEMYEGRCDYETGIHFLEKALNHARNIAPGGVADLLTRIGALAQKLGNTAEAADRYFEALKCTNDESVRSDLHYRLGIVIQKRGNYREAADYFEKALISSEKKDHNYVNITNNLSYCLMSLGKLSDAHRMLEVSMKLAEAMRNDELKVKTLYLIAVLEWHRQNYDDAIKTVGKALKVARVSQNADSVAQCMTLLASLYQQKGDFVEAEQAYSVAIQSLRTVKDINALAGAMVNQALVIQRQNRAERATELLKTALNYAERVGNRRMSASIMVNLANIYERKCDFSKAIMWNQQAKAIDHDAVAPIFNLSMLYYRQGNIGAAEKLLNEALSMSDEASYYFALALIKGHSGKVAEAECAVENGLKRMMAGRADLFKKMECYLKIIEFYYDIKKYRECNRYALEAIGFIPPGSWENIVARAISDLCRYQTGEIDVDEMDISSHLDRLKKAGCLYDWASLKRRETEALYDKRNLEAIAARITELFEAEEIFANTGAGIELSKTRALENNILAKMASKRSGLAISGDFLKLFHQISEVINRHLGAEDFAEKVLDLIIPVTKAERGALFLIEQGKEKLVAGRNLDQETLNDAKIMSSSVVDEARKKGVMICAENALTDERFRNSRSVILNDIHSLMCAPLVVDTRILGAIYLDSKHAFGLFGEKEGDFLRTVANFMASVIEKSMIFQRAKEENVYLRAKSFKEFAEEYLIGESAAIQEIRSAIEKVAVTDSTILITGETGCGKSIVARIIHQRSPRRGGRFVSVNCGGLPDTLFESELFGYKRGAFTGAHSDKLGLFEEANGGTLFLDEISNAPMATQGKLLEAIETKKIRRLGDTSVRKMDVRLISATNQDLKKMTSTGIFRADLYYRVSVITIHIPPLRERMIDLPILAEHFLEQYAYEMNKSFTGFDRKALKAMLEYYWPGNVRELANAIERAVIFAQDRGIMPADLKLDWGSLRDSTVARRVKQGDKKRVVEALSAAQGNVSLAAKILGVTRATMYNYMKKYQIQTSKKRL